MPLYNLDRAATVSRFLTLEVDRRNELQQIVDLAAEVCGTRMALITLLDEQMQYMQFVAGFQLQDPVTDHDFCHHTIQSDAILEVTDARQDKRFYDNPLVVGEPHVRFYAGAALATRDGYVLGCLSVLDSEPGHLSGNQRKMLQALSGQIIQIIEFDLSISLLKDQVEQLQVSEIKLNSFFESTVSCHLLIGKELEVLAYNRMVAGFIDEYLQMQLREKMAISEFLHDDYKADFILNYNAAIQGQTVTSEKELTYQNGRRIYWYMNFEPAFGRDREIIGVSFNATDITERIHQGQLVLRQNQALRKIAYVQSHELRRPVSSILGIVELIKSEVIPTSIKEEITMLDQAAKELDVKIREVISFTA
jgi:PAS domain-containing protein